MDNSLYDITLLNINYMSNLNFIDIVNLHNTSPIFKNIDINVLLRQSIYNKTTDVDITPNYNIYNAVNEFYTQLDKIVNKNYSSDKLPDWIDKEKFINAHKQKLIFDLLYQIYLHIYADIVKNNSLLNNNEIIINLDKKLIISSLLPTTINKTEYYRSEFKGVDNVVNTIKLSDNFINYIKASILNVYEKNKDVGSKNPTLFRWPILNMLEILLFAR